MTRLKQIMLFRKLGLGLPVSDIREILEGKLPLREALAANVTRLEQQIRALPGAKKLCRLMEENDRPNGRS